MIALAAEAAVPVKGLFGAWDQQELSLFGASSLFLISCAAVRPPCLNLLPMEDEVLMFAWTSMIAK